jgi:sugar phosphate isomerase/epimerase
MGIMKESKITGASLGGFKGLTLEEVMNLYLKLSNDFGLNAVEIRFEKEIGRPSLWSWEVNSEVVNFLDNLEVKGAHLPFVYLNPISLNPKIRKESINQIKDAIKKASELGMSYTVMHARGFAYGLTYEQQIEEWKKVIKELTEYAGDNSILLTLENADFLSNLKDIVSVVKEVKSKWLKMTLDVGHAHLRSVPPLSTYPMKALMLRGLDLFFPFFIKTNMPYKEYGSLKNFIKSEHDLISNVHVHDYNGRRDHIAIREGKIDFSFLAELKNNFKGPYIFEMGFENHYNDFEKNYRKFMELMKA